MNYELDRDKMDNRAEYLQGGPKKRSHRLMTIFCPIITDLTHFFTERFFRKFVVKWILKIPPRLAYVACETLIIIIKGIYIAQVRKGHKCAMSAEMAVWLRNCLYLYSYLSHN